MRALVPALLLLLISTPLTAKELRWSSIDVEARLDARGSLHVRERQSFVFDGDWNGGERTFNVDSGQPFQLLGLDRVEDNGRILPLREGSLENVGSYQFTDKVLRWRSRHPSDPPFKNKSLTYDIRYVISGVLLQQEVGDGYRLNHEFTFADRAGPIESFSLNLSFDPEWEREPIVIKTGLLAADKAVIVDEVLLHHGKVEPNTRATFLFAPDNAVLRPELAIHAFLDDSGRLVVHERQRFILSGKIDSLHRSFQLTDGAEVEVLGVDRVDADGTRTQVQRGDLTAPNRFSHDGGTVRWNPRLPSDRPFSETPLTYELRYVVHKTLVQADRSRYIFWFNFAPNQDERISRLQLNVYFADIWSERDFAKTIKNFGAREPFVFQRDLGFRGIAPLAVAWASPSPLLRRTIVVALGAGLLLMFLRFYAAERARGRFDEADESVDLPWLQKHVLSRLPELVGYMYYGRSRPDTVAAVLARLEQEGKIKTSIRPRSGWRRPVLEMELLANGREFEGHESTIKNIFFVGGKQRTDTEKIRKHYRNSGFNPAKSLGSRLANLAEEDPEWQREELVADTDVLYEGEIRSRLSRRNVLIAGYALLILIPFFGSVLLPLYLLVVGSIALAAGSAIAAWSAGLIERVRLAWFAATLPVIAATALIVNEGLTTLTRVRIPSLAIGAAFIVVIYWAVLQKARSTAPPSRHALRQRLAAARRWFIRELRTGDPALKPEWTPWLLALGLGTQVNRWFSAFGGEVAAVAGASDRIGSSGGFASSDTSSSVGGTWGRSAATSFGGAGASGSWLAATGALTSGMSAPMSSGSSGGGSGSSGSSSSSSGSSSSSSGSSSGGGGGGGW